MDDMRKRMGFLTTNEVGAMYGVSRKTVAQWLRDGLIPSAERIGMPGKITWLIPQEALKDFVLPRKGWPKGRKRKCL